MSIVRSSLRLVAAVGFIAAGANHFVKPDFYRKIVPLGFGDPAAMVAISGVAEILGGVGLFVPKLRQLAGWGLIALLVAVFPANLYMALSPQTAGAGFSRWMLWARLPFQIVFIAWIVYVAELFDRRKPTAPIIEQQV